MLECHRLYRHHGRMTKADDSIDLNGKLLVAMPGMGDPRFDQSVIFMCSHSDEGAMGLIINKPAELEFSDLLEQLEITHDPEATPIMVHVGGPVEHGRGFVLHSADYDRSESTLEVTGGYGMTATLDILEDLSRGVGPKDCILAMGYAGWGPGQLENEIVHNGWLTCDARADIIFGDDNEAKWIAALESMGIDPLLLSATAGHA